MALCFMALGFCLFSLFLLLVLALGMTYEKQTIGDVSYEKVIVGKAERGKPGCELGREERLPSRIQDGDSVH